MSTKHAIKNRVVTNWKSTVTGLLIAGLSVYLLLKGAVTWDQVIGFWTVSGLLAWVKDSIFKP